VEEARSEPHPPTVPRNGRGTCVHLRHLVVQGRGELDVAREELGNAVLDLA